MSATLLLFASTSFTAFLTDSATLLLLSRLTGSLLLSVCVARLLGAAVNFTLNRSVVFRGGRGRSLPTSALRFALLNGAMLLASYTALRVLTGLGLPLLVAKVASDLALFFVNYHLQRRVVFGVARRRPARARRRLFAQRPASFAELALPTHYRLREIR